MFARKKTLLAPAVLIFLTVRLSAAQVLFISSYSESFETINAQKQGIHEVFDKAGIGLDIEYMDMKRFNTAENEHLFHDLLKYKLSNHGRYDAVMLGDDAALDFAITYQNELFKNIPLVFFCINNIKFAVDACHNPLITGSVERFYLEDIFTTALKFQPNVKHIIAIYDNTLTGKGDQIQFYALKNKFPRCSFSGINASLCTRQEFIQQIESVPSDSIILSMSSYEDSEKNQYTMAESVSIIAEHAKVPVYRASVGTVGYGFIGGKVFDYTAAGKNAAETVLQILDGKRPSDIPLHMQGEGTYIFDYTILKKYGIKLSLVPKSAVIINKSPSLFEKYRNALPPIALSLLISLIIIAIVVRDNVRWRKITGQFRYQAEHEYLTGLFNRRAAMDLLDKMLAQKTDLTVILMDLDDFKQINDAEGHTNGDLVLKEISERLLTCCSSDTVVSRHGGDEFFILMKGTDQEKTLAVVTAIRAQFKQPVTIADKKVFVKASIGIASTKSTGFTSNELLSNADLALYSVKKSGKNNFAYYDAKMKAELLQKKQIESILSVACANDDFFIVYQPQVNVTTQVSSCYEALLRISNCSIPPSQFIPIAEETGLIITIGRIVTEKVIAQIAQWRADGIPLRPVSINFSSKQMRDTEYVHFLQDMLEKYAVTADLIEIEITESIFLDRTEKAMKLFKDFAEIGVSLTLDDFGTGYSSISYLTYIPVHKIKIDKSLIDIYLHDGKDSFVENIIRLAHGLGLKITVEGVEEQAQVERLKSFACDYIQGYYFSKPVTGIEIEQSPYV